ncbi:D-alanine--D-alanine ligase family protein [Cellulomonas bogoriensis]|uniref:D-alanine--D-alanine ligase n=1 Tax=Cellulomonas bogoriensis 69B4 = DSM 16987 TaxID=1386082 RepID=A0A0A0BY32_9CELL|nr:D-alanine--D-alanine ligase [Cellulomonas bogoriensis]KGM13278.1 D-alanine--D-alanine ligase [Cellulomonas bogoriensis 69B4 = DSM 16987]
MSGPTVLVLAGGLSHERDVSLRSGRRVAEALRSTGVDVSVHDVDADLLPLLDEVRPALVWPLLHGASGEDGSVKDVLEMCGLPYVGADPRASRLAWSKPVTKTLVASAGLHTPRFVTLPQSLFRELGANQVLSTVTSGLGLPLAVKPSRGGSALGVTIVRTADELPRAMVGSFAYGDTALIEEAVDGTEVAVSVVDTGDGPHALPPVEIVTDGSYDYDARYVPGRTEYFTPARLSDEVTAEVCRVAVQVHRTLGLRHLSRTDLILDPAGQAQVLDVNTAPGMTETSLLPQAAVAAGHDLGQLYGAIVEAALAQS